MAGSTAYELVFIDADDTLFDFGDCESRALAAAFAGAGLRLDAAAAAAYREINAAAWKRVELRLATQAHIKYERFETLVGRLGAAVDPRALADAYIDSLSNQRSLIEGAVPIVAYLAQRYRLVMITNGIAGVQRGRIECSPLRPHFADIVISEEVGVSKPDPRIFAIAAARGRVPDKAKTIMIGDSLSS
ncbi:MAG: HAD-IA family hydrolase, partial [Spirochaetaceae bacterium]|nr:HAD-IA family hydrolase [Spirochaetaceae bacterium]